MKYPLCKRWMLLSAIATFTLVISLHVLGQAKLSLHEDAAFGLDSQNERAQGVIHADKHLLDSKEEKFMTFYPHSGLHNQRLSLLNAAMVAKWLNRTLIIPEVNIATATYWKNSTDLPQKLHYCPDMVAAHRKMEKELGQRVHLPSECFDYRRYVPVSFSYLFDLSPLSAIGVRYTLRDDMHYAFLQASPLNIPSDERNRSLVYQVVDDDRYSYRIYDSETNDSPLTNFTRRLTITDLQHRPERLIIFNSMFGSKRLALNAENSKLLDFLRESVGISHPIVDSGAEKIIAMLGGRGQYVSAHIRSGDGIFKQHITDTIDKIKTKLDGLVDMEISEDTQLNTLGDLRKLQLQKNGEAITSLLDRCMHLQPQGGKFTTLFMATDSIDPRNDPNMRPLFDEFVCSFTLSDFPEVIKSIATTSPRDNQTEIGSLLIPLVDAVIASYGKEFVGTPKSTFSGYVKSRQQALVGQISSPTV